MLLLQKCKDFNFNSNAISKFFPNKSPRDIKRRVEILFNEKQYPQKDHHYSKEETNLIMESLSPKGLNGKTRASVARELAKVFGTTSNGVEDIYYKHKANKDNQNEQNTPGNPSEVPTQQQKEINEAQQNKQLTLKSQQLENFNLDITLHNINNSPYNIQKKFIKDKSINH